MSGDRTDWDKRIEEGAAALMAPRDPNGAPLDEVEAAGEQVQLGETAGRSQPARRARMPSAPSTASRCHRIACHIPAERLSRGPLSS